MKPDISYLIQGMFTVFFPETSAGEDAWRVIAAQDGYGKVLTVHLASVLRQIRRDGLIVAKARKPAARELDAILNELS